MKGSLEDCEGQLEQLQDEVELARKAHDAALKKANDPNSTDATKQLKRLESKFANSTMCGI